MQKPVSFTLGRFLQTNFLHKEEHTYTANLRSVQKQDTSSDESHPRSTDGKQKYCSFREIKRRKTNFESSDEEFPRLKSIRRSFKQSYGYRNENKHKNICLDKNSFEVSSSVSEVNKYQSSTSKTRRGCPKYPVTAKIPQRLTETSKYTGRDRDTKRLDDFLEQHSQYIDESRLLKALNIPKKYCKSNVSSETSREETGMQSNSPSPDSTMNLNDSSASTKSIKKYVATSDNRKPTLSTPNTDLKLFKSNLKGSLENQNASCRKPSKTPQLDEFLRKFSQKNNPLRNTIGESSNVSSSCESEVIFPKTERKQLPIKKQGSQTTMLSFFRKSKKYPHQSFAGNGYGKSTAPVHEGKENREQDKKLLFSDRIKDILIERKRRLERVQEKRRHLIQKRNSSDSSEDSCIRKSYSRKRIKDLKTKPSGDHPSTTSLNKDHISKIPEVRSLCSQSSSKMMIGPKNIRKIFGDVNKECDVYNLNLVGPKSRFLMRKSSEELSRGQCQKYLTGKELFSQELQKNIKENIWDASSNAFQASRLNLKPFENDKFTRKTKIHNNFLRKSSSESNLINQSENKPFPKLTFKNETDSRNLFRFSSVENIPKKFEENHSFNYLNLKSNHESGQEDRRLENTKGIQKNDLSTSNFEIMLRHMSKYIEYTTSGNPGQNMVKTSATRATKSQKNLLSSEGFHESMSTEMETPVRNNIENIVKKPLEQQNLISNNENIASKGLNSSIYEGSSFSLDKLGRENNGSNILSLDTTDIPPMENVYETHSFKTKASNDTSAKLSNVIQDYSLPKPPLHNMKTSKETLSDPISLGSPPVANETSCQYVRVPVSSCVQARRMVTIQKLHGSQTSPFILKTQQKKEKFDSQALKDLCSIHKRNNWESQLLAHDERDASIRNTHSTENDSNCLQEDNETIATSQFAPIKSSNLDDLTVTQLSSEIFRGQSNNAKNNNSQLQKATSITFRGDIHDNHQRQTESNEDDAYILFGEQDACHTQNSYEETNNLLTEEEEVATQTQSFTQPKSAPKNKPRIRKRAYNITEGCILFGDQILKELLDEKPRIVEAYNKNKAKMKSHEEADDILAKTYIKRYKKGKSKIFKIKRRLKVKQDDVYRPPEDHIIDRFTERLNNDFKDKSSSEREDDESVSTPSSYVTDETKSEPLSTGSNKLPKHQRLLREGVDKLSKDRDLLFSRYSDSAPKDFDSTNTLNRIYEIILGILEDYEQERDSCLKFPKAILSNYAFRDGRYQMAEMIDYTSVVFKQNRWTRFNLLLFILNKIRLLLETDTKLTKRELYYQLKIMVSYQSITDKAIRDISRILNVGAWALNLTAQKGLVYGNLKLIMSNGEIVNCNVAGTSVPKDVMDICEIQSDAYFILVVEKESVFHKLLEEDLPRRLTRPFIMITGKGFPDLNTQLFLKKLWMVMTIPVFILVDADPDGIAIMLNYRFGSMANAHVSGHLAVPKARWIGVFPSEINKLSLNFETLTKREITKTRQLLQLQCVQQNEKIKEQLETLLQTEVKAGIESVMKTDTYLSHRYLSTKFYVNDLI